MTKETRLWNRILRAALAVPGVGIDRQAFLTATFGEALTPQQLQTVLDSHPAAVVPLRLIDNLAQRTIARHTRAATTVSALTGLPGGPAVVATVPADLVQYYFHLLTLAQKLAYLYGFPELREPKADGGKLHCGEDTTEVLTLFVGAATGARQAGEVLTDIGRDVAVQISKKIPQQALAKTLYYPLIRQVARHIGLNLSKASITKQASRLIPVLGGMVSGSVTYATFRSSATRLQKTLVQATAPIRSAEVLPAGETADELELTAAKALLNMALMGKATQERRTMFLKYHLAHTTLPADVRRQLLDTLRQQQTLKASFALFADDPVSSAQLMRLLAEAACLGGETSVTARIYLSKIAQELGYTPQETEAFLEDA